MIKITHRLLHCVILILWYVILAIGKYERGRKSQTVAQKDTDATSRKGVVAAGDHPPIGETLGQECFLVTSRR